MCLKYYIRYPTCDHHEYLGSHHCSLRPCDLDTQHFHYIEDDFPVPWPDDLKAEQGAFACKTCATKQHDEHQERPPVLAYAPTNNFSVKEIRPTGYELPINVIRVEEDDVVTESSTQSDDSGDSFDCDYKSLSDADDEEWDTQKDEHLETSSNQVRDEVLVPKHEVNLHYQPRRLPYYPMLPQQTLSFVPLELTPEAYTAGYYLQHMGYQAPSPILSISPWHSGITSLFSIPTDSTLTRPDSCSPQLFSRTPRKDTGKQSAPASRPRHLATPPPTPPTHPLPPRPTTPPFIVGRLTDAYLRLEATKFKTYTRWRHRRQASLLQDALPTRKMALTEFMVKKRAQNGRHKSLDASEAVREDAWPSLPFAGDSLDTQGGAEEPQGWMEVRK